MNQKLLITLYILIAVLSSVAAAIGIFSNADRGPRSVVFVRGAEVQLYGKGIYHHMSAEVAPQGIAQDYVTLFVGVPALLLSLIGFAKGNLRATLVLAGITGYFLVTYGFYTLMAMYNDVFLLWVVLLSLSFYTFVLIFRQIEEAQLIQKITSAFPVKFASLFLMVNAVAIFLLWLSIVVPPALTRTIPAQAEHYTTLVVQALDLAILLPASFIAGFLLWKRQSYGYKLAIVYLIFLSLQMAALTAKVIGMGILGYNIIPVVFIIPSFFIISVYAAARSLTNVR